MSDSSTDLAFKQSGQVYSVRKDPDFRQMLLDLEEQISRVAGNVSAHFKDFPPQQMVQALSDRELLTLELWATDEQQSIADEIKHRRAEYEKFTRRLGDPARP